MRIQANSVVALTALMSLMSCGSDSKPAPTRQPQIDARYLGTWQVQCQSYDSGSSDGTVTITADGKFHSENLSYASRDCSGTPSLSSTDMSYTVVSSTDSSASLRFTDIVDAPSEPTDPKLVEMTVNFVEANQTAIDGTVTSGVLQLQDGTRHVFTPEEIALFPVTRFTKL